MQSEAGAACLGSIPAAFVTRDYGKRLTPNQAATTLPTIDAKEQPIYGIYL